MKMSASGPDRTSNAFGAQSLSAGLSKNIADSGGLGNTRATPVGRPTTDLSRVAGMMSRGRARPGQVQAAQMMAQADNQERGVAALEKYYSTKEEPKNEVATTTPLAAAASTMGVSVPTTPAAPAVIGDQFGSAASNSLMPTVGTINRPPQKRLNTLDALQGSANQMGVNSFAPKYQ
jgi:hypothetical protein